MSRASGCTRAIEIFAASSTGCIALSRSTGLPLACIRASADADAAIEVMNRSGHGNARLWPDSFQPFEPQAGWTDWHALPFEGSGNLPHGVNLDRGRLRLDLPANLASAPFETELHAALRLCKLDVVTTSPAWLVARSDAGQPLVVLPSYTLADPNDFRAGAAKVDDLFVLEPHAHADLVARLALRALTRAIGFAGEELHDGD